MLPKSHLWPREMAQWVKAHTVQVRRPEIEPPEPTYNQTHNVNVAVFCPLCLYCGTPMPMP